MSRGPVSRHRVGAQVVPRGIEAQVVRAACDARARAYAPHSGLQVGAALLTAEGAIVMGANVENASYGLTVCAERVALWRALMEGARAFRLLAVAADLPGGAIPCGACRQTLAEFSPRLPIIVVHPRTGRRRRYTLSRLLPHPFALAR